MADQQPQTSDRSTTAGETPKSLTVSAVAAWQAELMKRGLPAVLLASGTEGAVYLVADDKVAKVWNHKTEHEVRQLATFYQYLHSADLPFSTPEVLAIGRLDDAVFSLERRLIGEPMFPNPTALSPPLGAPQIRAIATVLRALGSVPAATDACTLPVLGESEPPSADSTFTERLASLIGGRVSASLPQILRALPEAESLVSEVLDHMARLSGIPETLIHGDLIPANILVDGQQRVTAVLDFGFLTMTGPPVFDAGVTSGIWDMYGADRDNSRRKLLAVMIQEFGYERSDLAACLSAYALATITVFGDTERDGHFRWCCETLRAFSQGAL